MILCIVGSHPGAIAEAINLSKGKLGVVWQAKVNIVLRVRYLLAIESVRGIVGALVLAAGKEELQAGQSKGE